MAAKKPMPRAVDTSRRYTNANAPLSSIQRQLSDQETRLLRQGQAGPQRYSQIRTRHIWYTYYFLSGFTGSAIDANYQLVANDYLLFVALPGSSGAGLPTGFFLTDLDTNFPSTGRVSDDQNFSIWELGITIDGLRADVVNAFSTAMTLGAVDPADVDQITQNGLLVIKFLTNEVILGTLADFIQSGGVATTAPTLLDYSARGGTEVAGAGPAGVTGGLQEGGVSGGGAQAAPFSGRHGRTSQNAGNAFASPGHRIQMKVPIYLPNTATFQFKIVFPRALQLKSPQNGGTGGFRAVLDWWAVESFREQA